MRRQGFGAAAPARRDGSEDRMNCGQMPPSGRGFLGLENAAGFDIFQPMIKSSTKASAKTSARTSNKTSKKASRQLLYIVLAFAAGLVGLAGLTYGGLSGRAGPAIGGAFAMTAQDGHIVTNRELEGRPYLVFFGYTHCPDFCPTTLFDISAVFKEMGADKKIAALFVTVDPARDTPDILKTYLENFDPRIIGLSSDPAKIEAIAKTFRVFVKKVPGEKGDYTVDHTAIVYLMDKRGRFVNAFNLGKPPKEAARELEKYL
jgi:protein SCO1/2